MILKSYAKSNKKKHSPEVLIIERPIVPFDGHNHLSTWEKKQHLYTHRVKHQMRGGGFKSKNVKASSIKISSSINISFLQYRKYRIVYCTEP